MAALSEEQSLIRDQAKSWAGERFPVRRLRELRDSGEGNGHSPQAWSAMVETGWTGILVPEDQGGSDLGYLTFGVVLEELGRQLTPSPLLASALVGASALRLGGTEEQKAEWLPRIVDGSAILILAVDEGPRHSPERTALAARPDGDGFLLEGAKSFVPEGMIATTLVVAARTSGVPGARDGISLFLVPADAEGIRRSALVTADSRGYADIEFDAVRVGTDALLGTLDGGFPLLDAVLDRARAGLAAEMLGTAAQSFDMTLEYLKTRKQFGRVIGSFQALGHRAADLYSSMEMARSCAEAALQAIDADEDAAKIAELSSLAQCKVGDFLHLMSREMIQIHGGIGMTDEFDAGFYLKRARALEALYGNQAFHRERYARLLGY